MSEPDAKTLDAVARRYFGLQRWYWRFFLGGIALIAVFWTAQFAPVHRIKSLIRDMLALALVLGFLSCCVGSLVVWSALMRFRCPRCGKRFLLSSSSSWPTATCKHCGLYLE